MLTQIVKSREPPVAMALKWPFAGMLTNMSSQMLTSCEAQVARRISSAEEPLPLLLASTRTVFIFFAIIIRAIDLIVAVIQLHNV